MSDKYAGKPYQPITIPRGASFADMVALKGDREIGDKINKKIIAPLVKKNEQLSLSDFRETTRARTLRAAALIGIQGIEAGEYRDVPEKTSHALSCGGTTGRCG